MDVRVVAMMDVWDVDVWDVGVWAVVMMPMKALLCALSFSDTIGQSEFINVLGYWPGSECSLALAKQPT